MAKDTPHRFIFPIEVAGGFLQSLIEQKVCLHLQCKGEWENWVWFLKQTKIFCSTQSPASTPWVLISSPSGKLAAQFVIRGPCTANIVLLHTGKEDISEVCDLISAEIKIIDPLKFVNYPEARHEMVR